MDRLPDGSLTTVLVSPEELRAGEAVVRGETYRHLFRARRLAAGDRVRAVDGRGGARWGRVAGVDRAAGRLALAEPAPANEARLRLDLLVAVPRPQRAAWLVEKATEVGVAAVRFLAAERAARDLGRAAVERLGRVAASAVEQCHRAAVPEVSGPHPWAALEGLLAAHPVRWVLDAAPASPPDGLVPEDPLPTAVLVGPEGGWSASERDRLRGLGCRSVSLGPRTLRLETAALAVAALVLLAPRPPSAS